MAQHKVKHRIFGDGFVTKIRDGFAFVKFGKVEKQFALKGFDKFFEYHDVELQKIVNNANGTLSNIGTTTTKSYASTRNTTRTQFYASDSLNDAASSLLGPRAQTINVASESQMFEIVGYMARPGRISSIEAEVPRDGRDERFERFFPGQTYRPITMGDTPSGLPNKLSPQFRINFSNLRNCPQVLKANMGAGNAACVGRINKSRFVLFIVQNYGFRFGDTQNVSAIRQIAADRGYLAEFEKGYSL